jgi:BirA family transcriptional regulator, biotin operon repressor / biotin---[acetyl-CoA-carboxylase] ligase
LHKIFSKNLFIGKKVVYLPKCHSTNSIATQLAEIEHVNEGAVVITDEQLAGRGQRGNTWESEAGKNIMMSVVLKPTFLRPSQQFFLNIIVSIAVKQTLSEFGLKHVKVKWPNDIYAGNKKVTGILIESTLRGSMIETSVVGIGLNVNQLVFTTEKATSMALEMGNNLNKEHVLEKLSRNIESLYLQLKGGASEKLKSDYLKSMIGWEERRSYRDKEGTFEGEILDVSELGKLRIERGGNVKEYDLKEIEFVWK